MKKIWDKWEIQAIEYLKLKWYQIITTNYKFWRIWEVDIVASKNDLTIFFEVKYRDAFSSFHPLESITFSKQKKIYKTILSYIQKYNINEEMIRFDVITFIGNKIEHIEWYELRF